jgi:hypothetical protein
VDRESSSTISCTRISRNVAMAFLLADVDHNAVSAPSVPALLPHRQPAAICIRGTG